jgi:hypothetical protein
MTKTQLCDSESHTRINKYFNNRRSFTKTQLRNPGQMTQIGYVKSPKRTEKLVA